MKSRKRYRRRFAARVASSRAEKPKKVQNVFIFGSPEREKNLIEGNSFYMMVANKIECSNRKQTKFLVFGSVNIRDEHPPEIGK